MDCWRGSIWLHFGIRKPTKQQASSRNTPRDAKWISSIFVFCCVPPFLILVNSFVPTLTLKPNIYIYIYIYIYILEPRTRALRARARLGSSADFRRDT